MEKQKFYYRSGTYNKALISEVYANSVGLVPKYVLWSMSDENPGKADSAIQDWYGWGYWTQTSYLSCK